MRGYVDNLQIKPVGLPLGLGSGCEGLSFIMMSDVRARAEGRGESFIKSNYQPAQPPAYLDTSGNKVESLRLIAISFILETLTLDLIIIIGHRATFLHHISK